MLCCVFASVCMYVCMYGISRVPCVCRRKLLRCWLLCRARCCFVTLRWRSGVTFRRRLQSVLRQRTNHGRYAKWAWSTSGAPTHAYTNNIHTHGHRIANAPYSIHIRIYSYVYSYLWCLFICEYIAICMYVYMWIYSNIYVVLRNLFV